MFEIIETESCPIQNQPLFEKSSIPWTYRFRQRNPTSCQKSPRPKKSEDPLKQRCNEHLRKFKFLQYIHKDFEFECGFETFV